MSYTCLFAAMWFTSPLLQAIQMLCKLETLQDSLKATNYPVPVAWHYTGLLSSWFCFQSARRVLAVGGVASDGDRAASGHEAAPALS